MLYYVEKGKYIELRDFLREFHQIDLDNYRESFIYRRIGYVFNTLNIRSVDDFIQRTKQFPEFLNSFLNNLGVEESEILRDPTMWNIVMNELIPDILKRKEKVRIYLPDFTTGEELLSLLILLKEYDYTLNAEIYASTGISKYIIDFPKLTYSAKKTCVAENNSKSISYMQDFNQYYTQQNTLSLFCTSILKKAKISYLELDLIKDDLPQKMDIVLFRNKLLYYSASSISNILDKLKGCLNNYGFLITGAKDMLIRTNYLNVINKEDRIYQFYE